MSSQLIYVPNTQLVYGTAVRATTLTLQAILSYSVSRGLNPKRWFAPAGACRRLSRAAGHGGGGAVVRPRRVAGTCLVLP